MKTLVINSGSSSLKYQLFDMPSETLLCKGMVDRIGLDHAAISFENVSNGKEQKKELSISNHEEALNQVILLIEDDEIGVIHDAKEIALIAHRIVHGGTHFSKPHELTEEVINAIEEVSPLAPLHNPHNLTGVKITQQLFPQAKQVGVFDTAFHQTIPEKAYHYALPKFLLDEHGVRVYGFHGTSHRYITEQTANYLGKERDQTSLISLHLGNGCSIAAVKNGKCIDTSMGFSPLDGLVMGTRSGDIDPAVVLFLQDKLGMSTREVDKLLNKQSGLLGLCGSSDLREIIGLADSGDKEAELAIEIYSYRIRKYIGSYLAAIGKVDAIVCTAGVGENSALIRQKSLDGLEHMGVTMDTEKNNSLPRGVQEFQKENSSIMLLVIPTNEELAIAQASYRLLFK